MASSALDTAKTAEPAKPETAEDREKAAKLEALSKQTGISVETLKQIKAVENSVRETKQVKTKLLEEQKGKQKCQQLTSLAATIRQITLYKNTSTFTLSDLINQLADTTRGTFMSTRKYYCPNLNLSRRAGGTDLGACGTGAKVASREDAGKQRTGCEVLQPSRERLRREQSHQGSPGPRLKLD